MPKAPFSPDGSDLGPLPRPASPDPRGPALGFHLGLQRTRLGVYAISGAAAVAGKLYGAISTPWGSGLALLAASVASALALHEAYRRGLDRRLGVRLEPVWMGADALFVTCAVYLTGGVDSLWYVWYVSNTGAAAFVGGAPAALAVGATNAACYVGLLAWLGQAAGRPEAAGVALGRIALLYGAAFFFLRGIVRLRENREILRQLQREQALKLEEMVRLAQELDHGTRALAAANIQIREADRVKSQFLANMSHELRTPLNSIIGFSEILLERLQERLEARHVRFLRNIHSSGQHLLGIINDILDLSKVEAGKMELNPEPVPVRAAIEGVLAVMQGVAGKRGISFAVDVPEDLPALEADPAKFKQVLYNLLSNAVKFSPDGAQVGVRVRQAGAAASPIGAAGLTVSVVDHGIGIAPADREIIFHEFRQADGSSTRAYGGTGLGLAIVKKLVEFQGGAVGVESVVGRGSTFSFTLPLAPRPPGTAAPEPEPPVPALPGGNRVLVVEDDIVAYQALGEHLREAGYLPIRARHGKEALEMARSLRPAAVTLDLALPDLSGWEVLKALKADPLTREVPVVIVSLMDNRELGLALGADDYFVKPVDRQQLLARLRALAPPRGPGARLLLVDDDPAVHEMLDGELTRLGYAVDHALSGTEALAVAAGSRPDAVVLDLMMPDMSGFEVADALREREQTRHVPIVVLTAKDLTGPERRALQGKIAGLVQKGQSTPGRLVAAIRDLENHNPREVARA